MARYSFSREKLYLAIHGKVYDCTSFIDESLRPPKKGMFCFFGSCSDLISGAGPLSARVQQLGSVDAALVSMPIISPSPTPPHGNLIMYEGLVVMSYHITQGLEYLAYLTILYFPPGKASPFPIPDDYILAEHPGGEEVLLDEAGRDASESFEDVGHSEEARSIMDGLYVGDLKTDGTEKTKAKPVSSSVPKPISHSSQQESGRLVSWVKSFF
ncbi:hypothetical protein BGZ73_005646 [Actinomortierella ambigua]|nr:hypothetical protein BGZ73_005646 [Actinomortierella ambigua]